MLTLALFYGGILQVLAGMWEFRNNRNTFGAVAFTTYGVFWLSTWYLLTTAIGKVPAGNVSAAVGTFLLVWTIFTFYMFVASLRLTVAHGVLFGCLLAAFIALTVGAYSGNAGFNTLAVGAYSGNAGFNTLGGWFGLLTAVVAWYVAAAVVVNSTFKRTVLPLYPTS